MTKVSVYSGNLLIEEEEFIFASTAEEYASDWQDAGFTVRFDPITETEENAE
jgi:hypothetical protein